MTPLKMTLLKLIAITANEQGLDPALMAGIVSVESKFNPQATGTIGERGLFQLHPVFFPNKNNYNACINIENAVSYLKSIKPRCKEFLKAPHQWIICHNRGVTGAKRMKDPINDEYYKKVLQARERYKDIFQPTHAVGKALLSGSPLSRVVFKDRACRDIEGQREGSKRARLPDQGPGDWSLHTED